MNNRRIASLWGVCSVAILCACATTTDSETSAPAQWPVVNVFVVAHQDDWQLFMNPEAFRSMDAPNEKAVFVHITAGDAGLGSGGEPTAYYLAREEGALRAVRFMANATSVTGLGEQMDRAIVDRGGHKVQRIAYANAVAYFLRLPDGNVHGAGYRATGWQSLERLRTAAIADIEAVDGSANYAGWQDLTATLADIVRIETLAGKAFGFAHSAAGPGD